MAHQRDYSEDMMVDELTPLRVPKFRNLIGHLLALCYNDYPPMGKSDRGSQAQGSKKAGMPRKQLRCLKGGKCSSSRTRYDSSSMGTSNNTSDCISLKARDQSKNRASIRKASSWITVLTFPWCFILSNYRHSLFNEQSSLSIWLPLLGMFNFTSFLSSLFLMVISGAHFTGMQITALLISAMVLLLAGSFARS